MGVAANMLESLKVTEISNNLITIDLSESDLKVMEHFLGISSEDKESFSIAFNLFVNDALTNYLKEFEDGR
jgi:hypothetical protein